MLTENTDCNPLPGGLMKNSFARRARRRAPAVIVATILATVTCFAVTANGHVVQKLELHDTGIWITNDADGYYGRLNKAALGLALIAVEDDANVNPAMEVLD